MTTRLIGPRDVLSDRLEMPHSDYLDPHHVLAAWSSATARYWRRRAATFEAARPRLGDFHGEATPDELAARWDRLTAIAQACRNRAEFEDMYGPSPIDVALIRDVASALAAAA